MKVIEVFKIKGGEVLGEPIYSKEGNILISKGTMLKSDYAELLLSLNISYIQVEDVYHSFEKPSLFICDELKKKFVTDIKIILEKHIYTGRDSLKKVKELAAEIIEETNNKSIDYVYEFSQWNANLYEHSIIVTILSIMIGRKLNLNKEELLHIAIGCLLHDLGLRYTTINYVNQSYELLCPSSAFEFKKHTIIAYTVLEEEKWIPDISKKMVLSHHEKMDGTGFPLKQKNKELHCKIIQLCDTYDCLVSGMECKSEPVENVIDYLSEVSGVRYDRKVVKEFLSCVAKYPTGTKVELSDGSYGIVCNQTLCADKPEIILIDYLDGRIVNPNKFNLSKESSISIKKVIQ